MKKTPIDPEASAGWQAALVRFDEDLRRRGVAEKTRNTHVADLRQFAGWAGAQRVEPPDVTQRMLRRYAAALSERRAAPAIVAHKVASLRTFFETLRERGEIAANPADLLAAPKRPKAQAHVLAPEEVSRLLDRIRATTPLELRDRALFEIAYSSGLRPLELVALDVRSVDFDAQELRVEAKDGDTRCVPAGAPALRALARYLERARAALESEPDEPALFLSKSGRRLSTSDVRRRLGVWARQAAVQGDVHPHAVRHARAMRLPQGAADARTIQELLGHASLSTTLIYSRIESARLKGAYARAHPRA